MLKITHQNILPADKETANTNNKVSDFKFILTIDNFTKFFVPFILNFFNLGRVYKYLVSDIVFNMKCIC